MLDDQETTFDVTFGPDLAQQVQDGQFVMVEVIKANQSSDRLPNELGEAGAQLLLHSDHHTYDGSRLVMSLGPDSTEDHTYSSIEVPNTRRFDQQLLDHLAAVGAPNVMIPGRQAIFNDVVFSQHFADGRAARETVCTGLAWQSWRGIEDEGLMPHTRRPRFIVVWFTYFGGPGLMPVIASRSLSRRPFFACVLDFNAGLWWFQPVEGFDPTEPHDIAIQWFPDRDISFLVDGRQVARYEDGRRRLWPLKLVKRQFARGVDLFGHKHCTADPSHITAWITCMRMGNVPSVPTGMKLNHDMWAALKGYAIEPLT